MSKNDKGFTWNAKRSQAAQLLAEGELTDLEIAERVGVTRQTLFNWRQHPDFAAKIGATVKELEAAVFRRGIARRFRRVEALNRRWGLMQQVIEERGADPQMQAVPGGKTGLLVHTVKGVGKDEDFKLIDLYAVDTGLLKELRDHERQAAQELGQWVEKVAPTTPDGQGEYDGLSDDERAAAVAALLERARKRAPGPAVNADAAAGELGA